MGSPAKAAELLFQEIPDLRVYLGNRLAILATQEAKTGRSQKLAWATEGIQLSQTLAQKKDYKKDGRFILVVGHLPGCVRPYRQPQYCKKERGREGKKRVLYS